jgi:probable HAF family extracellular repeat protein
MNIYILLLLTFCTVASSPFSIFAQDVRSSAIENPYSKANVGDWVQRKWIIKYSDSDTASSTMVERETVKEKNKDHVVISNKLTINDGDTKESERIVSLVEPFTILQSLGYKAPGFPIQVSGKGVEPLVVSDQNIESQWQLYVLSGGLGGATSEQKVWRSDKIPVDGLVKRIHTTRDYVSTTTLVAFGFANEVVRKLPKDTPIAMESVPSRSKWVNSVGISFMPIECGSFTMGQMNRSEFLQKYMDLRGDQRFALILQSPPKREVLIERDFYAAAHEVSIGQFRVFVNATGYKTDGEKDGVGGTGLKKDGTWGHSTEFSWQQYGFAVTDDYPVANVSWNDTKAFCSWLSKKEAVQYRLLTEAEWEYCCRGSTTTNFSSGNEPASLKGFANVADVSLVKVSPGMRWGLSHDDGFAYSAPVGTFKSNAFGLHDMHGNLLEWCSTEFDPFEPIPGIGGPKPASKQYVVRGGHWFGEPERASSSCRSGADPDHRMSLIGFRIATNDRLGASKVSKKEDLSSSAIPKSKSPGRYRMSLLSDAEGRPTVATRLTNTGIVLGFVNQERKSPQFCTWQLGKQSMVSSKGTSFVADINNNGELVATEVTKERDGSQSYFHKSGRLVEITPSPANALHMLVAVNSTGQIAGYTFAASGVNSWIYDNGTFSPLSGLGGNETLAFAINERGAVTGTAKLASGIKHAFIAMGEKNQDLGTLGGIESDAFDINDEGVVVGKSQITSGEKRAFVWRDKTMSELKTPNVSGTRVGQSEALSINNTGWIVGSEQSGNKEKQGIIWVEGVGFSLNDLVERSDGWVLQVAGAINDAGQIAGTAYKNGIGRAVLLTPIP